MNTISFGEVIFVFTMGCAFGIILMKGGLYEALVHVFKYTFGIK